MDYITRQWQAHPKVRAKVHPKAHPKVRAKVHPKVHPKVQLHTCVKYKYICQKKMTSLDEDVLRSPSAYQAVSKMTNLNLLYQIKKLLK